MSLLYSLSRVVPKAKGAPTAMAQPTATSAALPVASYTNKGEAMRILGLGQHQAMSLDKTLLRCAICIENQDCIEHCKWQHKIAWLTLRLSAPQQAAMQKRQLIIEREAGRQAGDDQQKRSGCLENTSGLEFKALAARRQCE